MITILTIILAILGIYNTVKGLDDTVDFGFAQGGFRLLGGCAFLAIALWLMRA